MLIQLASPRMAGSRPGFTKRATSGAATRAPFSGRVFGSAVLLVVSAWALTGQQPASSPSPAADWPLYNRDYASTRFSQLSEITPQNVSGLRQVCSYNLPEDAEFESGLIAVNGTLYFTTSDYTYGVDAGTCALRWRVKHEMPRSGG